MSLIFIDIEYNQMFFKGGIPRFDIIEIGAIKLNSKFEVVGTFQSLINPNRVYLNKRILEMMGVTVRDIYKAPNVETVMKKFELWLGINYTIFTWGRDDKRILLENHNYRGEKVGRYHWIKNTIDLQEKFSVIYDKVSGGNQVGLKTALDYYHIPMDKQQHRALNDAEYLAKIYIKMNKRLGLKNVTYMHKK